MKKLFLLFAALFTATVMNLSADPVDTLYLNTGGSSLWNQGGAKFSVWYWNDGFDGNFTDFLELAYGETDIYRAIIPKSDSVIFVRHAATADVPTWDNKLHQTKADEVDLEIGNIMVITDWQPADREWDHYTPKQAPKPDMHDFLYFVSLKADGTVKLNKGVETTGSVANLTATFEYSKDRINWTAYDTWGTWSSTTKLADGAAIALAKGDTVFFRAKGVNGKNAKVGNFINEYYKFTFGADDQIAAGGNVMSLYDATCEQDTMTAYGFCDLFSGASQLVSAPKLPATKMAAYCYNCMFKECTSLTQAPELKATTLAEKCYRCMFDGCTALTQAPALPADSLALSCYNSMFDGCTALTAAPELKATTLAEDCYSSMFYGCTALTQAPELKATTLAQDCYENMFYGCTSLQVDTCTGSCDGAELVVPDTTDAPINYWAQDMFYGCKGAYASNIQLGGHYCVKEYVAPDMHDFLYFVGLNGNDTVRLNKTAYMESALSNLTATFQYSKDRINWSDYTWPDNSGKGGAAIELKNAGDTVFFRAKGTNGKNATMNGSMAFFQFAFGADDSIAAGGNIMSLYDASCEQVTMTEYGFCNLFRGVKQLVSAPKLSATTLANRCYIGMFGGCTALTQAPALPADSLVDFCYNSMFQGCTALTAATELKATIFASNCCQFMFNGCSALTQAPELKATTLAPYCCQSMFSGCTSLTQAPELKATTLADYCYNGMFSGDTALTQAPALKATTLASNCCQYMFQGCTSLTQAPELKATKLADYCYNGMFSGCTALTQAPALQADTLASHCCEEMFSGCTALTQVPELKATTLADFCYCKMFSGCTALTQAPELKADTLASYCYYLMFFNCTSLTQAPELKATTLADYCYNGMFQGCTALTQAPALPADSLAKLCYYGMFQNCKALTQAPELKATTLAANCYGQMFQGCTSLTQAPALPADSLVYSCYSSMFNGCTALTAAPELKATKLAMECYRTMFCNCTSLQVDTLSGDCNGAELVVPTVSGTAPTSWNQNMFYGCKGTVTTPQLGGHYCVKEYVDMHDFLYLVSLKANGTVRLNKYGGDDLAKLTATFEYSTDRKTWTTYTWGGTDNKKGAAITLANAGDTVFFRAKGTKGKNATMSYNDVTYFNFAFNTGDSIAAGGNVMSLYDATCEQDTMTAYGFSSLFKDCAKKLVSVSDLKLPVTKLAEGCYRGMFYNCLKITNVPALPVTTLAPSCYVFMFFKCTSLTVAPELPATTLADNCYSNMFSNCTALTQAPELNATVLAPKCYNLMFTGCSSLTVAPELKATTLADSCYKQMFKGCTKLEVDTFSLICDGVEFEPTTTGAEPTDWNLNMFDGCKGVAKYTAQYGIQLGGHYCVKEYKEPVCKIGTKGYSSIAAAVAAVKAGDTIQVIKDIQLDETIHLVSTTPAFTLDLNGNILDGSALTDDIASLIYNEGALSIIDSDPTATHEAPFDTIAGAILTGGKGCKNSNDYYLGGAIYNVGTLNVDGVAFVNNTAHYGGAEFSYGAASIYQNCRFYGNSCTKQGAVIAINKNSQCSIDSCVIKDNSTGTGTVYACESSLTIAHTTITDNTSSIQGGGMFMQAVNLTLGDGLVVTNNTSKSNWQSGGIYIWTESGSINTVTMSGKIIIKDNTTNGQPANLCLSGDPVCDSITLNSLSEGSEIHVSTMINDEVAPVTFATNATEADLQYFKSDNGYAFVLDKNGKIVSKEAYGRKVTSGNYGTISLDKQFIAMEGVEALYVPSYKDASKLYCSEVKLSDVKAGGAYIFKANADSVTFALEGEAVAAAVEANYMLGWLDADKSIDDAFLTTYAGYALLANNQIVVPEASSKLLKNRAMIHLSAVSENPPSATGRYIALGINEATGLVDVNADVNADGKMMVNGQLIIIRDGVKYNAMGQKME